MQKDRDLETARSKKNRASDTQLQFRTFSFVTLQFWVRPFATPNAGFSFYGNCCSLGDVVIYVNLISELLSLISEATVKWIEMWVVEGFPAVVLLFC